MKKNKLTGYISVGICCTALTFGVCWYTMDYSRRDVLKIGKELLVIDECRNVMDKADYPFSDNDPYAMAISGYIDGLKTDEFTFYIKPSGGPAAEMSEYVNTAGTAEASGFQVGVSDDGNILLTDVVEGLAADKQGLKEGDVITAIDGVSVKEKGYENIVNKMLGKQDTHVLFTVRRDNEEFELEFIRDHVYKNYVDHEIRNGVGVITIRGVNQFGGGQFDQSVRALADCEKIIIDLRENPGGDGSVAMDWSARLSGNTVLTKYYYTGDSEELSVEGLNDFEAKKVIILVNQKTASAAEIITGVLAQNLGAKIVGTRTRGKGVFQQFEDLSNGGQLCYVAGWFTVGDWECWQGIGITPDVEVEMDSSLIGTDDDIQLKKALELLD